MYIGILLKLFKMIDLADPNTDIEKLFKEYVQFAIKEYPLARKYDTFKHIYEWMEVCHMVHSRADLLWVWQVTGLIDDVLGITDKGKLILGFSDD